MVRAIACLALVASSLALDIAKAPLAAPVYVTTDGITWRDTRDTEDDLNEELKVEEFKEVLDGDYDPASGKIYNATEAQEIELAAQDFSIVDEDGNARPLEEWEETFEEDEYMGGSSHDPGSDDGSMEDASTLQEDTQEDGQEIPIADITEGFSDEEVDETFQEDEKEEMSKSDLIASGAMSPPTFDDEDLEDDGEEEEPYSLDQVTPMPVPQEDAAGGDELKGLPTRDEEDPDVQQFLKAHGIKTWHQLAIEEKIDQGYNLTEEELEASYMNDFSASTQGPEVEGDLSEPEIDLEQAAYRPPAPAPAPPVKYMRAPGDPPAPAALPEWDGRYWDPDQQEPVTQESVKGMFDDLARMKVQNRLEKARAEAQADEEQEDDERMLDAQAEAVKQRAEQRPSLEARTFVTMEEACNHCPIPELLAHEPDYTVADCVTVGKEPGMFCVMPVDNPGISCNLVSGEAYLEATEVDPIHAEMSEEDIVAESDAIAQGLMQPRFLDDDLESNSTEEHPKREWLEEDDEDNAAKADDEQEGANEEQGEEEQEQEDEEEEFVEKFKPLRPF